MAKTEAEKNWADTRPGGGWRHCAECDKWTKGPRAEKCANPKCGKPFPVNSKGKGKTKRVIKTSFEQALETLQHVKAFTELYGGIDKTLAMLSQVSLTLTLMGLSEGVREIGKLGDAIHAIRDWEKGKAAKDSKEAK